MVRKMKENIWKKKEIEQNKNLWKQLEKYVKKIK